MIKLQQHPIFPLTGTNFGLRPLAAEDHALYLSIYCDPELMRFVAAPLTAAKARASFQAALKFTHASPCKQVYYVLVDSELQPSGLLGAKWFHSSQRFVEVGIILLRKYHHKGVALPALKSICCCAQKIFNVNVVVGQIQPENIAAIQLVKRMGFEFDATTGLYFFKLEEQKE